MKYSLVGESSVVVACLGVDSTGLEHKLLSIIVHFVPILLSTREPDSTVAEPHVSVFQVLA